MFRKKNKNDDSVYGLLDSSRRSEVYDFKLRMTQWFENYRAVDYKVDKQFEEEVVLKQLDEHLEKLFSGSSIDMGNCDVLEDMIFGACAISLNKLEIQHNEHKDTLRRLALRKDTDFSDFDDIKAFLEQRHKQLLEEYDKISHRLENL